MSKSLTTTVKSPLASHADLNAFIIAVKDTYGPEIKGMIDEAEGNGNLISISRENSTDATHYITVFEQEWIDQASYDSHYGRAELQDELSDLETNFEMSVVHHD